MNEANPSVDDINMNEAIELEKYASNDDLEIGNETKETETNQKQINGNKNKNKNKSNIYNNSNRKNTDNINMQTEEEETTLINDLEEHMKQLKFSKAECLCFFTFLIVFTVMSVLGRGSGDLNYTQTASIRTSLVLKDLFVPWNDIAEKSFEDITTIDDIYKYLNEVAIPFLLNPPNYTVQNQHILLGGLRLRQIRLAKEECQKDKFTGCWNDDEDKSDFMKRCFNEITQQYETCTFSYSSASELHDQRWPGKYGSYEGGGYKYDIPLSRTNAERIMRWLQNMTWIDGGTRFVSLDFNTYNPSTTLHTVSRLAFELPTGLVFPNDEIKTWKFVRYDGDGGNALLVFHILFLVFVLGMTLMTSYQMWDEGILCKKTKKHPCRKKKMEATTYWNSKWRIMDIINLIVFYITIAVFIYNEGYRADFNAYDDEHFVSFREIQWTYTLESYTQAINGLLLWLKLFKYFKINRRLHFLGSMLARSGQDILMFLIVLAVFFIAFGTVGFLTFSSDVDDFRSYHLSMFNMIRYTVTELDYKALTASSRTWGSTFYFVWSIAMVLILANVFIAILSEAYSQVQFDLTEDDKLGMGLLGMREALTKLATKLTDTFSKAKHEDIDADGDGQITADELAKKTNITIEEAQQVINEFDENSDGQLNRSEFDKLKKYIAERKKKQKLQKKKNEENKYLLSSYDDNNNMNNNKNVQYNNDVNNQIPTVEFLELSDKVSRIEELIELLLKQTSKGSKQLKMHREKHHNTQLYMQSSRSNLKK